MPLVMIGIGMMEAAQQHRLEAARLSRPSPHNNAQRSTTQKRLRWVGATP
jgi:hypothetical protein